MPKSVTQVLDDPSFSALSPEVQRKVLDKLGVSTGMQDKLLAHVSGPGPSPTSLQHRRGGYSGAPVPHALDFSERTGERIGQNVNAPAHILDSVQHDRPMTGDEKQEKQKFLYPFGESTPGKVAGIATIGPRAAYKQVAGMVKDYKDPAKLAGDAISLYAGSDIGPEGADKPVGAGTRTSESAERPQPPVPESLRPPLSVEQQTKYTDALDKANQDHAEALVKHAEDEGKRRGKWVEKTYGAKKSVANEHAVSAQRDALERGGEEYTRSARRNIQETHQTVRGRLDSRWESFRKGMEGATLDKARTYNLAEAARAKLRGSPQSIQQFNNLMKEMKIEEFIEHEDGTLTASPASGDYPLDTGRAHSSAIGDKLAEGGLPGNVYQAFKFLKEGMEGQIEEVADVRGRGDEYRGLKRDWHEYMTDWKDSGSPLADALKAKDLGTVKLKITGRGGDRLMETLGKYKKHGGRPALASNARRLAGEAKGLPSVRVKELPGRYEPGTAPKLKEVPVPKPEVLKAPKTGRLKRIIARTVGGATGGTLSHIVGVPPFIGWHIGADAASNLLEGTGKSALSTAHPLPRGFNPPE